MDDDQLDPNGLLDTSLGYGDEGDGGEDANAANYQLSDDELIKTASEATAAVTARNIERSEPPPPIQVQPADGGGVKSAFSALPPASERSFNIRTLRDLKNEPSFLGPVCPSVGKVADFHSVEDGRVHRSVLIENMANLSLCSASFDPSNWKCVACSSSHSLLPKKRNQNQWGGGA